MSTNVNPDKFTAEQMAFMVALADPNDHRTQEEIAKDLDVRPETLCRWKKLPDFGHTLWQMTHANLESEIGRVSAILLQNALSGNYRFMRMYYEILRVIGTQKEATLCNREHVLTMQEFSDGLDKQLTESQLNYFVDAIKWECGIPLTEGISAFWEYVSVDERIEIKVI